MRIDENLKKQEKLLTSRNMMLEQDEQGKSPYFLAYGEFERIGFDRVTLFSWFRDISSDAKTLIVVRQTLLVYDLMEY